MPRGGDPALLGSVSEALAGVRKVKSEAKLGMRAEVRTMTLVGPSEQLAHVRAAEGDLRATGRIGDLSYGDGDGIEVREAELIPVDQKPSHNA